MFCVSLIFYDIVIRSSSKIDRAKIRAPDHKIKVLQDHIQRGAKSRGVGVIPYMGYFGR